MQWSTSNDPKHYINLHCPTKPLTRHTCLEACPHDPCARTSVRNAILQAVRRVPPPELILRGRAKARVQDACFGAGEKVQAWQGPRRGPEGRCRGRLLHNRRRNTHTTALFWRGIRSLQKRRQTTDTNKSTVCCGPMNACMHGVLCKDHRTGVRRHT